MVYESVLLFGVAFFISALLHTVYPPVDRQIWVLQLGLFVLIGAYFVFCWVRGGQTLAMKSWGLRVLTDDGQGLSWGRAVARYLLAWHLFAPGLLYVALFQSHRALDTVALLAGAVLMLLLGLLDRDRRLLHDRWLGTRIVRIKPA